MNDYYSYFITWTTYGTWLPGDSRGWRKRSKGGQLPRPLLERWSREQMTGDTVLLSREDRLTVEDACREHCSVRGWQVYAVNSRMNHVHAVVSADVEPKKVRDQLKANSTRRLRTAEKPLIRDRTWTRGGDVELLDTQSDLEAAVQYVVVAQDRKDRDSWTLTSCLQHTS